MPTSLHLRTRRMALAPFVPEDADELLAFFQDAGVRRWLLDDTLVDRDWLAAELARSQALFAEGSAGLWAVRESGRAPIVGFAGFRDYDDFGPVERQLLYGLLPAVWGRGYATEAAEAVCSYAFREAAFPEIRAAADLPNRDSIRVLERLGMREVRRTDHGPGGTVFYLLEKGVWEARGRG